MEHVDTEAHLLRTLGAWSAASMLGGAAMWLAARRTGSAALRSFARQQVAWGGVDAAIAAVGALRRRSNGPEQDHDRLRRILQLNTALDVGYVAGGLAMVALRERLGRLPRYSAQEALGDGWGIVVQGGFLLVLDATHAAR